MPQGIVRARLERTGAPLDSALGGTRSPRVKLRAAGQARRCRRAAAPMVKRVPIPMPYAGSRDRRRAARATRAARRPRASLSNLGQGREVLGVASPDVASSPLASSCSSANSRIVSSSRSVARRPASSSCRTRLLATSDLEESSGPSRRRPLRRPPGSSRRRRRRGGGRGAAPLVEQVVAPGDGVAQRLLAGREVARAAGQQRQAALQPARAAPGASAA